MKMAKAELLLAAVAVLLVTVGGQDDDRPEMSSKWLGTVRGQVRTAGDGTRVKEFLGIPYALPPVGDRRFKKPVEQPKLTTTYEAVKLPPACPQYSETPLPWYDSDPGQSEDCLYLNMWAPADVGANQRPIVIYIHGGGWFETGSTRMGYYDGFGEALDTKDEDGNSREDGVVVVTINYRLGPLGFLSSGTDDAPGNMGLFDIWTAYFWLAANAQYVGGDYQQVTFVGHGSGAIAASAILGNYISLKPKYVLSGPNLLTLKALEGVDERGDPHDNNLRLTDVLARAVGCETTLEDSPKDTVACLRGQDASRLVEVMAALSPRGPPNVFLPQFKGEDGFFQRNPYKGLHEFDYPAKRDVLSSVTSDPGSQLLTDAFPQVFGAFGENDVPLSPACAKQAARIFLKKFPESVADQLLGDLDKTATAGNRQKVIQAFGDVYVNCPVLFLAEEQKRARPTFVPEDKHYIVEEEVYPPYNPWSSWMGSVTFNSVQVEFFHPDGKLTLGNETYEYSAEQMEQARVRKQMFSNFVRGQELPIPQYNTGDPSYSIFGADGKFSNETSFHTRNCDILRPYFEYKPEE